jgi:predicted metal-dependent hydrolase
MIDWLRRAGPEAEVQLNGETVPIMLRRHPTAKRLTLRLAPDGRAVNITLPAWAHDSEALAFAHARAGWLAEQHAKIPRQRAPEPGGTVQYRGEFLSLCWEPTALRRPVLDDGQLVLGGPQESFAGRIRQWFEREALRLIESDMRDYCAAAQLDEVPVALSRAQKRWGSCSDRSRIRINWRLIQAPDHVRRSVVAHEVAHLVHFDHSPAFYGLLDDIYEADIKTADRWLKQNGRSLYVSFG